MLCFCKILSVIFWLYQIMTKQKSIKRKSMLEEIWQDIALYLYLSENPNSTSKQIGKVLNLNYQTLNSRLKVRVKHGFILKTRIMPIVMGEEKLTFSLSDTTITFLKKLRKEVCNKNDI